MKVCDTNHVADFHDFLADFRDLCPQTLSLTFPEHRNGLNSITAAQTDLSQTCHGLCRQHLDMLRCSDSATFIETSRFHDLSPFVSSIFMTGVHDFPCGEVLVKVGIMEFGLYNAAV